MNEVGFPARNSAVAKFSRAGPVFYASFLESHRESSLYSRARPVGETNGKIIQPCARSENRSHWQWWWVAICSDN